VSTARMTRDLGYRAEVTTVGALERVLGRTPPPGGATRPRATAGTAA
jgi:hypothetical protein